jgi:hypothetical protein
MTAGPATAGPAVLSVYFTLGQSPHTLAGVLRHSSSLDSLSTLPDSAFSRSSSPSPSMSMLGIRRSQFQAVQFLPAFILPQILLCGLQTSRDEMARPLELVSWGAPMTYACGGLDRVTRGASSTVVGYAAAIVGFTLVALVLGALTLRRCTA